MRTPRYYQKSTTCKVIAAAKKRKNTMYVLPTGGGKTFIFVNVIKALKRMGKSIIVVVHRKELLQQAFDDLLTVGILPAIIHGRKKTQKQVSVTMAKTLIGLDLTADYFIFDEGHRGEFDGYFTEKKYKKVTKIACTATPIKNFGESKLAFSNMYQEYIEEATIRELLRKKFLCNVINKSFSVYTEKENISGTDFAHEDTVQDVLTNFNKFERETGRGKTLFFTANQKIAKIYMNAFENEGNKSLLVTSNTSKAERESNLNKFHDLKSGYDFMFSCDILLTGYNYPPITRIVWLRSTTSLIVWLQGNGRGSRRCDEIRKRFFYCLDFGGNLERLGSWDADHPMLKYFSRMPEENENEQVTLHVCPECFETYFEAVSRCVKCGAIIEKEGGGVQNIAEAEAMTFEERNVIKTFQFYLSNEHTSTYDSIKQIYLDFGRTALLELLPYIPSSAKDGKQWATDPEAFLEAFEDYYL